MTPVSLGSALGGDDEAFRQWVIACFQQIENASWEDIAEVADGYTITGTLTETRTLDVATPSTANIAAVLGTLITDLKRRGQKRDV
jgi:hypothetical protein